MEKSFALTGHGAHAVRRRQQENQRHFRTELDNFVVVYPAVEIDIVNHVFWALLPMRNRLFQPVLQQRFFHAHAVQQLLGGSLQLTLKEQLCRCGL